MNTVKEVAISKINSGASENITDVVVVEKLMKIYVNYELYKVLMCTPSHTLELAAGFLFSEGIIASMADIETIDEKYGDRVCVVLKEYVKPSNGNEGLEAVTSGCGNGSVQISFLEEGIMRPVESSCSYSAEHILKLMKIFNSSSELFKTTGGVHSCALCDEDGIRFFTEDVGRHNALDKVLGIALTESMDVKDKLILTTGRISSDIVVKAAKAGIPIVVSHSAPTDLALDIARAAGITLVGFARGNRMNIYCGEQRITMQVPR